MMMIKLDFDFNYKIKGLVYKILKYDFDPCYRHGGIEKLVIHGVSEEDGKTTNYFFETFDDDIIHNFREKLSIAVMLNVFINKHYSNLSGEPCRICGQNMTVEDIKDESIFTGYSFCNTARLAHKKCYNNVPMSDWIYK